MREEVREGVSCERRGGGECGGVGCACVQYAMIVPMSSMSRVLMPVMLVLMSMSRQNLGYS